MSETNTDFITGLRALADWCEAHPDAKAPSQTLHVFPDDTKEEVRRWSRMLGTFTKSAGGGFYTLTKQFGPVELKVCFLRDMVCQKRVVGTKTVTEKVPDPSAPKVAAEIPDPDAPLVEITREEEVVEWDCPPLLAPESEAA